MAIKSGVAWYYYFNGWLERSLPKRRRCCWWPSERASGRCRNTDADIVPADVVFLCPMIFTGGRHVTERAPMMRSALQIRLRADTHSPRPWAALRILGSLAAAHSWVLPWLEVQTRHNHSHSHLTPSKCVITHRIFRPAAIPMASFIKWFDDYNTVPHKFMPYDFRQSLYANAFKIRLWLYWKGHLHKTMVIKVTDLWGAISSLAFLGKCFFF